MTSLLSYNRHQHQALQQVHADDIVFYTVDHPGGGDAFNRAAAGSGKLPIDTHIALLALARTGAIEIKAPRGLLDRVNHTRVVALTEDGRMLLAEWGTT